MMYLYCGQNTFLLEQKLRAFKERYSAKFSHSLNVHYIDLSENGFLSLKDVIEGRSLFNETALVFVSGVEDAQADLLIGALQDCDVAKREDIVIVLYSHVAMKDLDKNVKTLFETHGKLQEFEPYKGSSLSNWIEQYVQKGGSTISRANVQFLILRRGEDMLSLSHELEKLLSYAKGGEITSDIIENLVLAQYDTDVFKTVDALARRDVAKALSLLWEHRRKGDDPLQILAMFAYQVRTLLLIKDMDKNAGKANLHPYVIQKNRPLSAAFEEEELIRLHSLIADSDLAAKTGEAEPYVALEELILEFSTL